MIKFYYFLHYISWFYNIIKACYPHVFFLETCGEKVKCSFACFDKEWPFIPFWWYSVNKWLLKFFIRDPYFLYISKGQCFPIFPFFSISNHGNCSNCVVKDHISFLKFICWEQFHGFTSFFNITLHFHIVKFRCLIIFAVEWI